jgi:photosystem II stability/assembly factor-like uncharacterized protein
MIGRLAMVMLIVVACAPTPTSSPTPTATPVAPASGPPSPVPAAATPTSSSGATPTPGGQITAYEPLNELVGWVGLRDDSGASLAKTTDGGRTWQRIGPAHFPGIGSLEELRFIDERRGFAIALAAHGAFPRSLVLVTDDGGASWTEQLQVDPPPGHARVVRGLVAVDDRHASVIVVPGPCDPAGCVTELRATADGGATWTTAYRPNGAVLSAAAFADVSRGWLAESFAVRFGGDLLLTSDGGRSWQTSIAADKLVPAEVFLAVSGPTPRDVWVLTFDAVSCSGIACTRYGLRASHDGGLSWMLLHALGDDAAWWSKTECGGLLAVPTFLDATHGVIPLGRGAGGESPNNFGGVLLSDDGGRTFQCVRVTADNASIAVRFANAKVGWALAFTFELKRSLYRTVDGGRTWEALSPPSR